MYSILLTQTHLQTIKHAYTSWHGSIDVLFTGNILKRSNNDNS